MNTRMAQNTVIEETNPVEFAHQSLSPVAPSCEKRLVSSKSSKQTCVQVAGKRPSHGAALQHVRCHQAAGVATTHHVLSAQNNPGRDQKEDGHPVSFTAG